MDYQTLDWTETVARIQQQIDDYKELLTVPQSELETSRIRGSIRALREVLEWPKRDAEASQKPTDELKFG